MFNTAKTGTSIKVSVVPLRHNEKSGHPSKLPENLGENLEENPQSGKSGHPSIKNGTTTVPDCSHELARRFPTAHGLPRCNFVGMTTARSRSQPAR